MSTQRNTIKHFIQEASSKTSVLSSSLGTIQKSKFEMRLIFSIHSVLYSYGLLSSECLGWTMWLRIQNPSYTCASLCSKRQTYIVTLRRMTSYSVEIANSPNPVSWFHQIFDTVVLNLYLNTQHIQVKSHHNVQQLYKIIISCHETMYPRVRFQKLNCELSPCHLKLRFTSQSYIDVLKSFSLITHHTPSQLILVTIVHHTQTPVQRYTCNRTKGQVRYLRFQSHVGMMSIVSTWLKLKTRTGIASFITDMQEKNNESTSTLKPMAESTKIQNRGYQWLHKMALKTISQNHPKSKTAGTSGSTKWL